MSVKKPKSSNRSFKVADQSQRDLTELIMRVKRTASEYGYDSCGETQPDYAHAKSVFQCADRYPKEWELALDLSSNNALHKVKWLLRADIAGHTATLDPLATGECDARGY